MEPFSESSKSPRSPNCQDAVSPSKRPCRVEMVFRSVPSSRVQRIGCRRIFPLQNEINPPAWSRPAKTGGLSLRSLDGCLRQKPAADFRKCFGGADPSRADKHGTRFGRLHL